MGQPGSLGHSCILLVLFCFIEVQLIYNVVVFSAVWQSDSVIQIHMYLSHILFHYGLLPGIEYSVLCYKKKKKESACQCRGYQFKP